MTTKEIVLVLTLWMGLNIKIAAFDDAKTHYSSSSSTVSAMFVLGDSSVDCGDNTLFYTFLHRNLSLLPCPASHDHLTLLPQLIGFEDIMSACCGEGRYGGESGCTSMNMTCPEAATHVWWDLYNPTPAVNSLVADSAWSGRPMPDICHPFSVQQLAFSSV